MIFEELKSNLEAHKKKPGLNRSKAYSQFLKDAAGDTRYNRKAQKSASIAAKKRPRKRGTCRGTAAIFWPLLQRLIRRLRWDGLFS